MAREIASPTQAAINSLRDNAFVTLHSRLEHGGALQARKLSGGFVQLYWRYSHAGQSIREPIGLYDPSAPPKKLQPTPRGYSIAAALERCRELAAIHAERANKGGLRAAKVEERKAYEAQQSAEAEISTQTLERLMETYIAYLKEQGRPSHVDVGYLLRSHVVQAWPALASTPAKEITPEQVMDMIRRLIETGRGRSANKLRSYLRAAYQCAADVRTTPSIPLAFKAFAVVFNPAAQTRRSSQFDCADKRPFSKAELRTYWKLIADRPGVESAVLRLHVLTGGQRIEQLARLRWADVDEDALTIFDGKGRPGHRPRPHCVPLVKEAQQTIKCLPRQGVFAISTTRGNLQIRVGTMAAWARAIVGDSIAGFQLKRVRSGVETLLASCGVSREIRGHLQSHGQTGVQARHYDGHDYMPEKRRALEILIRELRPEVVRQPVPGPQANPRVGRQIARVRQFATRLPFPHV